MTVVEEAYESLTCEEFEVSLLAHEAQHVLDLRRFPNMSPLELETRAKLSELSTANEILPRLVNKFIAESSSEILATHGQAAKDIILMLTRKIHGSEASSHLVLTQTSPEVIKLAARELILAGTAELLKS